MPDISQVAGPEGFNKGTGNLIYTCNCGWIDLSHANPTAARRLLEEVRVATANHPHGGYARYAGTVRGFPVIGTIGKVSPGLSVAEQQSVALGIFQSGSMRYEGLQNFFGSSSGFSQEDLVSNLIGFHAAAKNKTVKELIEAHCGKILSQEKAKEVFQQTYIAAPQQNRSWEPVLHRCTTCMQECPEDRAFPKELNDIRPAPMGQGWRLP